MNVSVIFIPVILIKLYRNTCFDSYLASSDVKSACENSTFPLDCNTLPTTNCRKNPFIRKGSIFFLNHIITLGSKWLFYLDIYIFVFQPENVWMCHLGVSIINALVLDLVTQRFQITILRSSFQNLTRIWI